MNPSSEPRVPLGLAQEPSCMITPPSPSRWDSSQSSISSLDQPTPISPTVSLGRACAHRAFPPHGSPQGHLSTDSPESSWGQQRQTRGPLVSLLGTTRGFDREIERPELCYRTLACYWTSLSLPCTKRPIDKSVGNVPPVESIQGTGRPSLRDMGLEWPRPALG